MEVYLEHLSKSMSEITQTMNTLKKSKVYDEVLLAHLQEIHRTLVYTCRDIGEQRHHYFSGKLAKEIKDRKVKNAFGGKVV
jgi:DNA repair ATPase RecN